jgi:hypothetical protein
MISRTAAVNPPCRLCAPSYVEGSDGRGAHINQFWVPQTPHAIRPETRIDVNPNFRLPLTHTPDPRYAPPPLLVRVRPRSAHRGIGGEHAGALVVRASANRRPMPLWSRVGRN